MRVELVSMSPCETERIGEQLGRALHPGSVVTLEGGLGTGKTCFTRGIARGLGIERGVRSPSFAIARIHEGRLRLYHVDLYRLESEQEIEDIGIEEYLFGEGVCVVEWADRLGRLRPERELRIEIGFSPSSCASRRSLVLLPRGPEYRRIAKGLSQV